MEVLGSKEKVATFINELAKGPAPFARVEEILVLFGENIEERVKFSQVN